MNRNVEIQFQEEPAVVIQPVTPVKADRHASHLHCNFWVGWQLFHAEARIRRG
jgi:hypothetical protein